MKNFRGQKYAVIYRLNTKIRLTKLCLSRFEVYSRWVPLLIILSEQSIKLVDLSTGCN